MTPLPSPVELIVLDSEVYELQDGRMGVVLELLTEVEEIVSKRRRIEGFKLHDQVLGEEKILKPLLRNQGVVSAVEFIR